MNKAITATLDRRKVERYRYPQHTKGELHLYYITGSRPLSTRKDGKLCWTTESYMIPITKTGEYLPNEAYTSAAEQEQYKQLVQKFQSDIQDVLQAAQTMWGEYL